jgi:DNA repair exonuclease SbcCD ATPase subunit
MAAVDVLELYDKLRLAPDEEARARLIAQAFSLLEARYPHLDDLVTTRELSTSELKLIKEIELVRAETEKVRGELKETELRLIKEIEAVRAEIEKVRGETEKVRGELKETELRLIKEIELVRGELKETELRLVKEIEAVRGETEKVRGELKETELRLVKEIESVRAELKVDIARSHAGLLKWSFLFWASQLGALLLLFWRLTGKG